MMEAYGSLHFLRWLGESGSNNLEDIFGCLQKKVNCLDLLVRRISVKVYRRDGSGRRVKLVMKDFLC